MWKQKQRKCQIPLKGNPGLLWGLITTLSKGTKRQHGALGGWGVGMGRRAVKKQRRKPDRSERGKNWGKTRTESVLAEGPLYFSS